MNKSTSLGGSFTLPDTSLVLNRIGYGAMQLAGKGVWGPPRDPEAAVAVLREAIKCGINHIDTSDFYGPHVTNQLIHQALHPYPEDLVIVTKVGFYRPDAQSWLPANSAQELISAVQDNLRNLGLETLHVVNLRMGSMRGPQEGSIAEPLSALIAMKEKGLIQHIGLSDVTPRQVEEGRSLTEIVCVQNQYNLTHRKDDTLIDELDRQGIAFVPYFPLGGFTPLQSSTLERVAQSLETTPMQVALAWLLQRSPNILLIPGTSSVEHLHENIKVAELQIPEPMIAELNSLVTT